MKKLMTLICLMVPCSVHASHQPIFNMGYVGSNNPLTTAGCFLRADNNKPFFDFVSIFAANINGADPDKPVIFFNEEVDQLLNHTDQVSQLKSKGVKVLLSVLGNHQNAGWSCMQDEKAINRFADELVAITNKYHLDGIDIDDEYSNCFTNQTSLIRIAQAIKTHPGFKGKLLSKALFRDYVYFAIQYNGHKLADFLDYGWEMSYGHGPYDNRLNPYIGYNMQQARLGLGTAEDYGPDTARAANYVVNNHFGGIMVFDVRKSSLAYLSTLAREEFKTTVYIDPQCRN